MDYNELEDFGGTSNNAAKSEIMTFVKRKQSLNKDRLMTDIHNKLRRNI